MKVSYVMATLSIKMLKFLARSMSSARILSETWSRWESSWLAEYWATMVLMISLQMGGSTFY